MFVRRIAPSCRPLLAVLGICLAIALALPATGQSPPPAPTPADSPAAPATDVEAAEIFRSAMALEDRGLYDLAAAQWASLAQRFPADPLASQVHYFRGLCLFRLERYDQAQAEFHRVIADWPQLEPALLEQCYVNLGLAQFNVGHATDGDARNEAFGAAIATLSTQLDRFPDGPQAPQARLYRAEARYAQGKLTLAIRGYQAFLKRYNDHPLRARALYGLAVAQQEADRAAEAAQTLEQFLQQFPQHELAADVHLRYGQTLVTLGRPADAVPHFAAAAAAEGFADADEALEREAACRCETKGYAAAARLYARLTTRFPDSPLVPEATVGAGKCYYLSGEFSEAIAWLRRGQELADDDPGPSAESAHWLGQALTHGGQAAAAVDVAERALRAAPPPEMVVRLRLDRADALYQLDDRRADAATAYAAVAREYRDNPLAPQAAYMAAYAALETGDAQSALARAADFRRDFPGSDLTADVRHVAAEAHLQLADYATAAGDFARLLADFPQHEAADQWSVRRALGLSLAGQHDEVIHALESRWSQFAEPPIRAEAALLLGKALLSTGDPEQAVQVLTAAAALPRWPQADQVLLTLARAEHASGKTRSAIAMLDRLIEQFPDSQLLDRAHYYRGEFRAAVGDDKSAIGDFAQVATHWRDSPLVPNALLNQARLEYRQKQLPAAQATLTRMLARYGHDALAAQAYLTRATVRYDAGDYAGGIADVTAVLKNRPSRGERSDALYLRGLCEEKLNRATDAIETFQTILHDDPQYGSADRVLRELAWACDAAGQPERAVAAYRRLARKHPDSSLAAEAWCRVGQSQYDGGQFTDAAESFQAARSRATDDGLREKATHKLAWAQFSQHKLAAAEETFSRQLADFPDGPLAADGAMMVAEARFGREDYAGALDAYETALAGRPARDDLLALGLLHAGQAAAQLQKWDRSLALVDRCRQAFPQCEWADQVRYERGWALYHLNRLDEARQEFVAAAGQNSDELTARARFMVGEVQFAQKQYDDAVRTFFQVAYGFGNADAPPAIRNWQAEALFEAARCLEQTKRLDAARKLYTELLERFPESSKAVHARNSLSAIKTR